MVTGATVAGTLPAVPAVTGTVISRALSRRGTRAQGCRLEPALMRGDRTTVSRELGVTLLQVTALLGGAP